MADFSGDRDLLLNELANEFAARQRRGETPSLHEYCERHPELADDIHSLFPALIELEQAKADAIPELAVTESGAPPVTLLGDFRLLREVGRGGMGVVYEAEQISLGRRVALKLLPASVFRDPVKKQRFEREAKAAAKLHHTNIVPVHGFGEHEGTPYYVMQYIAGLGLDAVIDELAQRPANSRIVSRPRMLTNDRATMSVRLARSLAGEESSLTPDESRPVQDTSSLTEEGVSRPGPVARLDRSSSVSISNSGINLPGQSSSGIHGTGGRRSSYWPSVARIGVQVAGALAYAHKQGISHRDIKPANLLLDLDGVVWVTDFGLAKADDSDNLTQTGDLLGTVRYMSPEAFEGKTDTRSDIYGLGLTLFEMIALRPAYEERDRHKLIKQVTTGDPPRLRKLRRDAPRDLVTIVEKACEKDPSRRYQSAGALADDLQRFLDGRPITARRANEFEKLLMWARRRPAVAGLVVSLFLCLLAGSVVSTVFAFRADRFARDAALRENEATMARDAALKARRALSRTLADSYVTLGQIAGDRKDAALAALWFANAAAQTEGDGHRDAINRIRVSNWAAEGILVPVAAIDTSSLVQRLDFHPSGRYMAGLTSSGEYSVWDLGASTVWRGPPGIEKPTAVAWDRDGTRVVLGGQDRAGMFAFPSGETIRTWDWPGSVTAAAFSPEGTMLALGGTTVQVWDVKADRPASPRWALPSPLHAIAFTPDGSRVVTVGTDQIMRIYAVAGDRLEPEFTTPNQPHGPPQFLDGGAVVVTFPTETTASGLDLTTGKDRFRIDLRGDNGWEFKLATSPDGKSIWAPNVIGNNVNRWNSAGQSIAGDFPHLNMIFSLAVSLDGSLLASGAWDRTLRIWDLKTRTLRFPEMTSVSSPVTVAWSPDGRQVAAAYEGRYLRVWALPPGLPVRTIEPGGAISMARFTPDARSLLPHSGSNNLASQRQVRLYDPATRKPNSVAVNLGGALLAADITADGRRLVTAITHLSDRTDESPQASVVFTPEAGEVRFWDVVSGRSLSGPIKVPAEPRDVRFRPDGSEAAVVCAGREVLILDPATGQVKKTFHPQPFKLPATFHVGNHQLCYSRDGQRLYVYGPNGCGLQVLHSETGETLFASGKEVFDVRESSDGSIVAVAFGRNDLLVRQFDTRTFQEVAPPIPHPDWVFGVRFDRTGDRLLTSCRDRAARLWDRKTGQMLAAFSHENEVVAAELFGEDRFVVSVGHDKVARISDAATGRPVAPPINLGGLGLSVDVSPDRRWAVIGGFTTRLTVLDLEALTRPANGTPEQLVRRSELLAGRRIDAHGSVVNLTVDEWKERWEEYRLTLPAETVEVRGSPIGLAPV